MLKKIFGGNGDKKPQAPPPPPKSNFTPTTTSSSRTVDAIQKLGETEELLLKRRELLEKKIAAELERARQLTRDKKKNAALLALKKKKMYEGQLEQVENNILRVSEEQMMLENTRVQMETLAALQTATHAAKHTMTEMKMENVDQVLDDINDQADQLRLVQDALNNPLGAAADLDEDELLNELEELEAEDLDTQLLEPAAVPTTVQARPQPARAQATPAAPVKTPEELELEALQAEMA